MGNCNCSTKRSFDAESALSEFVTLLATQGWDMTPSNNLRIWFHLSFTRSASPSSVGQPGGFNLASGGKVHVSNTLIAITSAVNSPLAMINVHDITEVRRESLEVAVSRHAGGDVVMTMASLEDASGLEAAIRMLAK